MGRKGKDGWLIWEKRGGKGTGGRRKGEKEGEKGKQATKKDKMEKGDKRGMCRRENSQQAQSAC